MSTLRIAAWVVSLGLLPLTADAANQSAVYTVRSGDTLWDLAQRHGCTVDQLRDTNEIDGGLQVGVELRFDGCRQVPKQAGRSHRVEAGDTLTRIARRSNTSVEELQRLNGMSDTVIRVGQSLKLPGAPAPTIRVVKGQSVGRPDRGKLVDAAQLPRDPAYYRRRLGRTYGAQHAVDYTRAAVKEVREKYPKIHRLAVGDLSDANGGRLSGHRSHQSGRDIDLGLYFKRAPSGYPKEFVDANDGKLHAGATWALVRALYRASKKKGGPTKVFLDYRVQKTLYEHALKNGVSKSELKRVFQYPRGKWTKGSLVQHVPNHYDHIHVRYGCPPKDTLCKN